MTVNLPPVYEPAEVEDKIYLYWLEKDYFKAGGREGKKPFTIVIPPPNVTGTLHMGHALNNTIQDVLIRWRRMQGYDTLWLPGTDHAGIATQNKVEEHLAREGLSRYDVGREKFLEKAWEWKEEYHTRILQQLYKLGVSCDWSRERFTMDEGCSRAVREVFVSLYEKGLIYRGDYLVNWCPRCHTAISDIEVEHEEKPSTLTHIRYPGVGWKGQIVVATTRPETMLGDTAVAVHPEDPRYRALVGKKVMLPLMNREIPIIADEYVDPSFGSGAVKITPAHDPNDFAMGQRHGLEVVKAIGEKGTITPEMGKYAGMDRYAARRQIVADLEEQGFLDKIDDYTHAVGHCQRCKTEIEPLVSLQWFVKMKPLAGPAINVVKEGKTRFIPERFTRAYLHWMENIRDWCISRQIWWGHRIPAWYCPCGEVIVAKEDPSECPACGGTDLQQDTDVLDTWFSSALWPFSTLGWPEQTDDLQRYFPTSALVTGYDIISFWVARMIFMSLFFMDEIPFAEVSVHGLVRDAEGRKMSKSLGNGIDPLEIIDQYGADTLRFTLITGQAPGNDQRFRPESVEASRNFSNKIWNASRYVLMNLGDFKPEGLPKTLNRHDRWILDSFNRVTRETTALLEVYELGEAARAVYEFVWGDFCDWYIELSKAYLYGEGEAEKERSRAVLYHVLEGTLRLLHPFMPFISEEIWQHLPRSNSSPHAKEALCVSRWPQFRSQELDPEAREEMELVRAVIRAIRNLRSEVGLPPGQRSPVVFRVPTSLQPLLRAEQPFIEKLAWVEEITFLSEEAEKPAQALAALLDELEVYLPLAGVIDLEQEIARLGRELKNTEKDLARATAKIANPNFIQKAPPEIVEKEKNKKEELNRKQEKISGRLAELKKMA
ncbi:MAG: valine--tRNA ligase [Firmicutes bacterium]|nr:valine--tRNA ligase [Bacillota bacterium]